MAKEILDSSARRAFLVYTTKARNQKNRLESAKELKKLVYFNTMVVGPLLDAIKSDETKEKEAKAAKEFEEIMAQARKMEEDRKKAEAGEAVEEDKEVKAEAEEGEKAEEKEEEAEVQPSTLSKTQKAAEAPSPELEEAGVTMIKSQREINLASDLDKRDRTDIYKNFLLYCMQGDVVSLPMGGTMIVERDQSEFQRLSQLGDVLGLNQMDVAEVHGVRPRRCASCSPPFPPRLSCLIEAHPSSPSLHPSKSSTRPVPSSRLVISGPQCMTLPTAYPSVPEPEMNRSPPAPFLSSLQPVPPLSIPLFPPPCLASR